MACIAVVGAGPAGSSAGYHLATQGHAVALIDRASFPRDKVCGDWVMPNALAELARMGIDTAHLSREAPGHARITRSALGAPNGRQSRWPLGQPGRCIRRLRLDAIVRQRALLAGCQPIRCTIKSLDQDQPQDGVLRDFDLLIDARGANAGAANAVALRAYWTLPRETVADELECVQLLTDHRYPRGYGWLFPVDVGTATVCYNVGVGMLAADSAQGHTVRDFFSSFETAHPVARRLRAEALHRERPIGFHVGLSSWSNSVASNRVLKIGDAANLADPLTGDGIGNALASGRLIARAIGPVLSCDEHGAKDQLATAARRWQEAHDAAFARDVRVALVLRGMLSGTRAKNVAATLLACSAHTRARLHGAVFGERPYRELLSKHW